MPGIVGDDVGVVTGLVIAEQVDVLCAFFEGPVSHWGVGVDLFDFVFCSAKRYFLISIDGLPLSLRGSEGAADYVRTGWSDTCLQSHSFTARENAGLLLWTRVEGLFNFSHLESLESLDRGANTQIVGQVEGSIEGGVGGVKGMEAIEAK